MPRLATLLLPILLVAVTRPAESVEPEQVWIPAIERSVFGAAREVRLEATLYRPPGDGPFPVLLFNHGSTGNGRISPTLTIRYAAVAEFFVDRGFAVFMPMRRGRGASDGRYEEAYGCEPAALSQGVERGTADVEAALTFALKQPWADPSRLVLGGMSRGGLLSVLHPSVRRVNAKGVINFAGGWTFDACDARARFNEQTFGHAGRAKLPMLWLYAENDRNYQPASIRAYHRAFTNAGGSAELQMFPPIGHDGHDLLPRSGAVWHQAVDDFLTRIGFPAPAR